MRFSKRCGHAYREDTILKGECRCTLKPGNKDSGINLRLQPLYCCLPDLLCIHTHLSLRGQVQSAKRIKTFPRCLSYQAGCNRSIKSNACKVLFSGVTMRHSQG